MAKLTAVDVYWQGPGWYVREVIYDRGADAEQHKYRFAAPLETSVSEMQAVIKRYERPPDYLAPVVKRWRKPPAANDKTTIHDVTD